RPCLLDQHNRNVVLDPVDQRATSAMDLTLLLVDLQRALALRTGQDFLEVFVKCHDCPPESFEEPRWCCAPCYRPRSALRLRSAAPLAPREQSPVCSRSPYPEKGHGARGAPLDRPAHRKRPRSLRSPGRPPTRRVPARGKSAVPVP